MADRPVTSLVEPRLGDLLERVKQDISRSINCVQVGTVSSFNATLGTAEVKINSKRRLADGRVFDFPLLTDCPVFQVFGGDAFLNMPVAAGDTCIVLFNDRDIDNWYLKGATAVPNTARAHSLSDGMVLVGVRPVSAPNATDTTSAGLDAGTHKAFLRGAHAELSAAAAGKVTIKNGTLALKTLIDTLITATETFAAGKAAGVPLDTSAAYILALQALQLQFDALLDV